MDVNISERTATAMLYAIKSDTLFFNRQTNRVDIEAFSYLYPLADAALIRKMEGAEITERAPRLRAEGARRRAGCSTRCSARSSGHRAREDFIPYIADFFLQLEDVKWTVIGGIVNDSLVISVRNLGYSKNAGEFVRRYFSDIGSAGGHRAMAKAVVPVKAFREKFGELSPGQASVRLQELVTQFLHEAPARPRRSKKRETRRSRSVAVTVHVRRSTFLRPVRPARRSRRPPAR